MPCVCGVGERWGGGIRLRGCVTYDGDIVETPARQNVIEVRVRSRTYSFTHSLSLPPPPPGLVVSGLVVNSVWPFPAIWMMS